MRDEAAVTTGSNEFERRGTAEGVMNPLGPPGSSHSETEEAMSKQSYQKCIEACIRCAQACEHCANSCLSEEDVQRLAECIRLDRDCAEVCWTAAGLMSRDSQFAQAFCKLCADVCDACAAECGKHDTDHCRSCADACRECANECRQMA